MSSINGKVFEDSCIRSINMNNNSNGNNWPVVPIFGRRKRPRQAFYASPSQDIYKADTQNHADNKSHGNNSKRFTYEAQSIAGQMEDDISLADFDYEGTLQNSSIQTRKKEDVFRCNNWPQRNIIDQRDERNFLKPQTKSKKLTQSTSLQKHPRNNLRVEREVKLTKEKEENISVGSQKEQRKETIAIQKQKKVEDKEKFQQKRSTVPRLLTLTTGDISEILRYKEMLFALYEIYGILDSQVASNNGQCDKRFIIRDSFGTIQCVFWEIDRQFPYIRRGTSIRCVGRLVNETFQCLSIRTTSQAEINYAKTLQIKSREVIDNYLLTSREY